MCRSLACAALVLQLCSGVARTAEPPDHLKSQVESLRKLQEEELRRLEKRLEQLQTELRAVRRHREKRQAVAQQIAKVEKQIDATKDGALPHKSLKCSDLSVGQIGRLNATKLKVLNVLGAEKMLVVPMKLRSPSVLGRYSVAEYHHAIQTALLHETDLEAGEPLMIYGRPTKGIVDGRELNPGGLVEVEGTEQYASLAGVKTVFKLRWYDLEALRPYLKKAAPPKTTGEQSKPSPYVTRTWTDSTGKFTVEAKFRGVISGNVQLEKADGQTISIPMERLSNEDREWIRDH